MSSQMIKVDPREVGKIIGTRGATIKGLQAELGVRINIARENGADGMREVEFSSENQNNVQNAIRVVIDRHLRESDQQRPQQRNYNNYNNDYNQDRNFNRNNNSGYNNRGGSGGYDREGRGNYQGQQQQRRDYNDVPQYVPNKRTMDAVDDWDDKPIIQPMSKPAAIADDDWELEKILVQKNQNQPSVNVYTRSDSSYNNNNNNNSNREKKFRPRDDHRVSSYTFKSEPAQVEAEKYEPIDWDKVNKQADEARKARWAKCPIMLKDFYVEHAITKTMTQEEIDRFRLENMKISVARVFDENADPKTMPKPVTRFEYAFERFPDLMGEIKKAGFDKPSPIQSQMWPILLQGEDCIGIAQTGTGKTLAFLLPALIHTDGQPHARGVAARGGPNVLILSPTRELAIQIRNEVAKYQFRNIRAVCLYGGDDRKRQIEAIEEGVEVIIATPGRLNDLVAANYIKIESITYLILDEADRMLDMGFEPQIRKILLDIRDDRQTVMTSATWPSGVRRLASSYMKNPYQVCVGSLDLAATHTVTQRIEIMNDEDKFDRIIRFVKEEMKEDDKAIIFCGKKDRADSLSCDFTLQGIACQAIHGNREQRDREQALDDIKTGVVKILIATDVASRGIDIQDITAVVNFDFPRNVEEYVHRVGRTGRAGKTGISLSFLTRGDWGSAKELIEILKEANQEIPDELVTMAERFQAKKERNMNERGGSFRGNRGNNSGFGGGGRGGRDRY